MNCDGTPGPDGFSGHLFQFFWETIAADVVKSIHHFFLNDMLQNNVNSNLLILIPKTPGAYRVDMFRPIALANFQFKIITKFLADRLAIVTSKLYLRNNGVIAGVASPTVPSIPLIGIFLINVLQQFGFNDQFCKWINEILHSAKLSILVNSKVVGYFNCTRGVRQGDPLSPLLVCIAEEVLGRSITKAAMDGQLCLMILCRGTTIPTHVLYVDDIMIFCKGTKRKIRSVLRIFNSYGAASRQVINNAKSKFYAGAISNSRLVNIAPQLGFNMGSLPFTYLGCPIFVGKPLKQYIFKLWRIGLKRN
ncbi:unnamed protein product [Trifolium pratense]|uniref:Uncharacterized protein n=1 Tax=Trifolium pratense TaxID=57577 RepID=A0ACB0K7D5_TRIPR|nr:unnamed protein product [Trifolium pratense]